MKKVFYAFLLFYVVYNGIIFARIVVTNHQANDGIELAQTLTELDQVKAENVTLKEKILQNTSLHTIDAEARANGFTDTNPDDYYKLTR